MSASDGMDRAERPEEIAWRPVTAALRQTERVPALQIQHALAANIAKFSRLDRVKAILACTKPVEHIAARNVLLRRAPPSSGG